MMRMVRCGTLGTMVRPRVAGVILTPCRTCPRCPRGLNLVLAWIPDLLGQVLRALFPSSAIAEDVRITPYVSYSPLISDGPHRRRFCSAVKPCGKRSRTKPAAKARPSFRRGVRRKRQCLVLSSNSTEKHASRIFYGNGGRMDSAFPSVSFAVQCESPLNVHTEIFPQQLEVTQSPN